MKKVIIMFALAMGIATANAQENVTAGENNGSEEQLTLTKEVYPQKEADGDLYHGLTKKLTFDRMVPPHGLEVTYDKTVHVIFPAEVRYVDLGSPDLIAVWGVFIWKEFKGADRKTNTLLAVMFLFFIAGLASIIASGGN